MITHQRDRGTLYAGFVSALILLSVVLWISPDREGKIISSYLWPAAFAGLGILLAVKRRELPAAAYVGIALACWLIVCTILNGDKYLEMNRRFLYMTTVSYGLCLPLFLAVTGERRVKLGALMAAGYGAVMTVVAVISLVACFTGKPIYLPYAADMIGVKLNRLFVLGRHPNEVGSCMNLALLCWLLLCLCTKRWLLKAVCMAMAVPVYLAIGATTSRTAVVIASLVLAIFVVAIALDRLKAQKRGRQWLIGTAALTLAAAVSLVVLIYGVPSLLRGQTDAMTAKTTEVAASADAAAEPEDKLVSRGLTDDVDTVTSRFKIWKSGFDYIKDHPKTLLIGSTDGIVARIQTYYLRWPANHMQNALLEVLLQGGILGLALYLAFLLQFLRSAFVLFFKPDAVCWQRFIAAASVATLLSVAMETYPSLSGQTMDLVFMVIAGAVIGLARGGTAAVVKDQRSIADE